MATLGVLGPLLLEGDDGPVRIGSARQRRLLVALAAHLGRTVEVDRLVDLVWGDDVPGDPAGAVQTNVARLRRLLPTGIRLATAPEGYRLEADRATVDVAAFADHLAAAAADPSVRLARSAAALALWRGRPYGELEHPSLEPDVARLVELRAGAAQQHAEALLAVGRAAEAVAELEALVAAEPLREAAVGALMTALVAAGRQGDALAAYARLRTRLADELGLDPSPPLRDLERAVLRQELPGPVPQAAAGSRTAPALPLSSFVGRVAALDRVVDHVGRCRVVTLCGPGGVGKTRLAMHAAAALADRYADGVTTVAFGDGGPADVVPLVAAALRLTDAPATGIPQRLVDRVVEVLAVSRRLLLLDNCEHVPDEVAPLVEAVAAGAPGVDVLLTSREPLRVDGEQVVVVAPLDDTAAARLLTDRIGGAGAGPDPDPALVTQVCRRLDGLPLALELAAGRARSLGLPGLLDALDDEAAGGAFAVLRGGHRTAAPRHRSLRDLVAWSHGLLGDGERTLFERMSVFAGPVERAAVTAVCGNAEALPDLVDRSLVVCRPGPPARFGMLETLRAFGRSRLAADPAAAALRARHATWAADLADEVTVARRGPGEVVAVRRFDAHLADLRRAHAWLCERGPVDELLRVTVPVGELASLRGRVDLVRMLEVTLRVVGGAAGAAGHPLRARLLGLCAHTWWQRGDLVAGERYARDAIAAAGAAGDPTAARDGHEALSNVLAFRGELAAAQQEARVALDLARAAGDLDVAAVALADLVVQSAYAGDDVASAAHETQLRAVVAESGAATVRAYAAYACGERRAERGDPGAEAHLRAAVDAAEEAGLWFVAGIARHTLVTRAARDAVDPAAVLPTLGPLVDHWHAAGSWTQLWIALRALTETLSRAGRHDEAATLLGASEVSTRAAPVYGTDAARVSAVEDAARAALGEGFAGCRAEGARLGDAGAVALARRLTRGGG